jgi:hypothetical protein
MTADAYEEYKRHAVPLGEICDCCGDRVTTNAHGYHMPQVKTHTCYRCGVTWTDVWCAGCDDECPKCGRDIALVETRYLLGENADE